MTPGDAGGSQCSGISHSTKAEAQFPYFDAVIHKWRHVSVTGSDYVWQRVSLGFIRITAGQLLSEATSECKRG